MIVCCTYIISRLIWVIQVGPVISEVKLGFS